MDEFTLSLQAKVEGTRAYLLYKRAFDLVVSFFLLAVLSPLLLSIGLLILWDSGAPAIYKQERLGLYGRTFVMYKFRTMHREAESQRGPVWADVGDPRVTYLGRALRRLRLDELPQLINIARGEMSLVGPRPERPVLSERFTELWPLFPVRLLVKPGLTGLSQVSGGYELSPAQKLLLDIHYIENLSVRTDLAIMLKTLSIVLTGHGSR